MAKRKLAIVSFTRIGTKLNVELAEKLEQSNYECKSYSEQRFADEYEINAMDLEFSDWIKANLEEVDGFIFISAIGDVVRAFGPFVNQDTDITMVVLDEMGQYVIPFLSTREGLANMLSGIIAKYVGGIPVLTTASVNVQGRFSLEKFIERNGFDTPGKQL